MYMQPDWFQAAIEFYPELVYVEERWMFVFSKCGNQSGQDRDRQTAERVLFTYPLAQKKESMQQILRICDVTGKELRGIL